MSTPQWRVEVRLVPGGRLLLKSHMRVRGLTNMELARLCGSEKYRSSISHLVSGARDGCSEELAAKLTKVLLKDAAKDTPLFTPRVYRVSQDSVAPLRRAA
jgi:antitoxin component HigA of HigAB toxin-antitoxin module